MGIENQNSYIIRPAETDDFEAIAYLLVQLYEAELPGAIVSSSKALANILQFSLRAKDNQGKNGRFVLCTDTGEVIGSITVEIIGRHPFDRAPAGIVQKAFDTLGVPATLKLLVTIAKSVVPIPRPQTSNTTWVHSLIVAKDHRGQGLGKRMMHYAEKQARHNDLSEVWLQVLAENQAAIALYKELSYKIHWQSSKLQSWFTWPSYVLQKNLK